MSSVIFHGDPMETRATLPAPSSRRLGSRVDPLLPLYVTYGVLQLADAHSTLRGLSRGAREQNPVIGSVVNNPGVFIPVKVGSTIATVYLVERLRKRNPKAAVFVMVAVNAAYGVIVHHNYKVGRPRKRT